MNGDDERKWRERVDERLVDLTTSARVVADRLDQMDEVLSAVDGSIRGDVAGDRHGLVARMENVELSISKISAVLFVDSTGKRGLLATVDNLVSGKMDAVERRKSRASVIIAIITSAALVITNLDRLGEFWVKTFVREPKVVHIKKTRVRRVIDYSEPASP